MRPVKLLSLVTTAIMIIILLCGCGDNKIKNNEINKEGKYYSLPDELQKYDGFINLVNHIIENSKSSETINNGEYVSGFWD